MGKLSPALDDRLRAFVTAQRMFFVATAPAGAAGHVNCSPKGLDTFRVLGPTTVAWADFVGSGAETIAHLRENGRICVMFCAFEGAPNILRLYGRGRAVEPGDAEFGELRERLGELPAAALRTIVVVEVERIQESCGFGVPLMRYEGEREQLTAWSEKKGAEGAAEYQRKKNRASIDGLPALRWVQR